MMITVIMIMIIAMIDDPHDQEGGEVRDDVGDDDAHLDQGGGEVGGRFLSQCSPSASPENVGI